MARRCEKSRCVAVRMKQNLPGGTSAVVPPDPMPNSEVKRRSADGSVGSPHARVGNCQASNKWKTPVERLGFFAMGILNGKKVSAESVKCVVLAVILARFLSGSQPLDYKLNNNLSFLCSVNVKGHPMDGLLAF